MSTDAETTRRVYQALSAAEDLQEKEDKKLEAISQKEALLRKTLDTLMEQKAAAQTEVEAGNARLQKLRDDVEAVITDPNAFTAEAISSLCQPYEKGSESEPPVPRRDIHPLLAHFDSSPIDPLAIPPGSPTTRDMEKEVLGDTARSSNTSIPSMTPFQIDTFLSSAKFKTTSELCTTIIMGQEGKWIELRCSTCGGNWSPKKKALLRGLPAFQTHLNKSHGHTKMSEREALAKSTYREVADHEIRTMLATGSVGMPFVDEVAMMAGGGEKAGLKKTSPRKRAVKREQARREVQEKDDRLVDNQVPTEDIDNQADGPDPRRRSARIKSKQKREHDDDDDTAGPRPAPKKVKRTRKLTDEEVGEQIVAHILTAEDQRIKVGREKWLADANAEAASMGLLKGRIPFGTPIDREQLEGEE